MDNQKLQLSNQTQYGIAIPEEWKEHFLIKRFNEENIPITLEARDKILNAINEGQKYIQIGKYTLMLNSIKSIDPVYEPDNIPPCPKERFDYKLITLEDGTKVDRQIAIKDPLRDLWFELYGKKVKKFQK